MDYIENRVLDEAEYIIMNNATVRATAKEFGVGKSTVHKDLTERLLLLNKNLYRKVRRLLNDNLSERHNRGGAATKAKYTELKRKRESSK